MLDFLQTRGLVQHHKKNCPVSQREMHVPYKRRNHNYLNLNSNSMELDGKWNSYGNCCNIKYFLCGFNTHWILTLSFSFVLSFTKRCAPFLKLRYSRTIWLVVSESPEQHISISLHCRRGTHSGIRQRLKNVTLLYLVELSWPTVYTEIHTVLLYSPVRHSIDSSKL